MQDWKTDETIIKLDSFAEVCRALQDTYTISMRGICEALQCSRTWANTNIKPFIPHIVLMNGKGKTPKINWQQMAGIKNKTRYKDTLYFDEAAFKKYCIEHVTGVTRQTVRVRESALAGRKAREFLLYKEDKLNEKEKKLSELTKGKDFSEYVYMTIALTHRAYDKAIHKKLMSLFSETHAGQELTLPDPKKRTATKAFEVAEIPPLATWQAPHDYKGYGDTDEGVYVSFFNQGRIRIECSFGEKGQKVYYAMIPDPPAYDDTKLGKHDGLVTVSMQDATKYSLL